MIVVGSTAIQRTDGAAIHAHVTRLAQNVRAASGAGEDWRVLNVLHRVKILFRSGSCGAMRIFFTGVCSGEHHFSYLHPFRICSAAVHQSGLFVSYKRCEFS